MFWPKTVKKILFCLISTCKFAVFYCTKFSGWFETQKTIWNVHSMRISMKWIINNGAEKNCMRNNLTLYTVQSWQSIKFATQNVVCICNASSLTHTYVLKTVHHHQTQKHTLSLVQPYTQSLINRFKNYK